MVYVKIFTIVLISIVLVIYDGLVMSAAVEVKEDEMKVKPTDVLPSIVTKIVRRGLVPKRSRLVASSTTEIPECGECCYLHGICV